MKLPTPRVRASSSSVAVPARWSRRCPAGSSSERSTEVTAARWKIVSVPGLTARAATDSSRRSPTTALDSRLGRLEQVRHGDLGAGIEQRPHEPPPDEPGTSGHQHPGTLFSRHMFSVRGSDITVVLTRFYRDPAGGVAWSGEATRYDPAAVSPGWSSGPCRGPGLMTGYPGILEHRSSRCPALAAGLWLPRSALQPRAGTARRVDSVAAGCQCFPWEATGACELWATLNAPAGAVPGESDGGARQGPEAPLSSILMGTLPSRYIMTTAGNTTTRKDGCH